MFVNFTYSKMLLHRVKVRFHKFTSLDKPFNLKLVSDCNENIGGEYIALIKELGE